MPVAERQRAPQPTANSGRQAPFFAEGTRSALKSNKKKARVNTLSNLKERIQDTATQQSSHHETDTTVQNTQAAVYVDPALQQSSQESTLQVQAMAAVAPSPFDAVAFSEAIMRNVRSVIPRNMDEFDNDPTAGNRMQAANDQINQSLDQEQNNTTSGLTNINQNTIDNQSINIHRASSEMQTDVIGNIPQIENAGIAPPLHTQEQSDLTQESQALDIQLEQNGINENLLRNSNEPSFNDALLQKQESQSRAANTHQAYLIDANPQVQLNQSDSAQQVATGLLNMHNARSQNLSEVQTNQSGNRAEEESIRTRVAQDLDTIFLRTESEVNVKLETLNTNVRSIFSTALSAANTTFENNVRERTDIGILESIGRAIMGIPADLERVFREEQALFIDTLQPVIQEIGQLMETELNASMLIIEQGKQAMQDYWMQQDETTQRIAGDIFATASARYATLEQQVQETNQQLQDEVTQQFTDAVNALQETFDRIKEENKSWLDQAFDAIVGVIEAIIEMKNLLLDVLRNAANAINDIIADPVGFLSNLLDAIIEGFLSFKDKIVDYIQEGMIAWLLGNMPASIVIPDTWDLKGIFQFVASIIGLTWDNIKDRAIRKFGPTIVSGLETAFEVFIIIQNEGIAGLWDYIKERLNNLQEQVLGSIQELLIERVIKAGITWVISLFNPASAFLKACKLIYDVISWFINNARRLLELISSIVDSIALIAAGNISAAAQFVEQSLARAVPVVIGFLAGLLGIGDLSERIQRIIDRIRQPINNAIDWVLDRAQQLVRSLLRAGQRGVVAVAGWLGLTKTYRSRDGNTHRLFFEEVNGVPVLMRASVKTSFETYMQRIEDSVAVYNRQNDNAINFQPIREKYFFIKNNMGDYNNFKSNQISQKMDELVQLLSQLPDDIAANNNIFFPSHTLRNTMSAQAVSNGSSQDGQSVALQHLSLKLGNLQGSPGRHTSNLFRHIYGKIRSENARFLIRGHLLNHYLGGTGDDPKNIAPIAKSTNDAMERNKDNIAQERRAKKDLMSGCVFDYAVTINYAHSSRLEASVPDSIQMKIQNRVLKNNVDRNKANMEQANNWDLEIGPVIQHTITNAKTELENLI